MADDDRIKLVLDVDSTTVATAAQSVHTATAEVYEFADSYEVLTRAEDAAADRTAHVTRLEEARAAQLAHSAAAQARFDDALRQSKMTAEEWLGTQIKVTENSTHFASAANAAGASTRNLNVFAQQTAYALGDFAQTSGDVGQKLMSMTNNIQFIAAGFGIWGAAIGLVTVGLASAIRNAGQFGGILTDGYIPPAVLDRTRELTKQIQENEKAFDKLRDKVYLSADELKRFNTLQAEGIKLAKEKADQEADEQQRKEKGQQTNQRAADFLAALKSVGGEQAQRDIEERLQQENPSMNRDLIAQRARNLRLNAAEGQQAATDFLYQLFANQRGRMTPLGQAMEGEEGKKAEAARGEQARKAAQAAKDAAEDLAKAQRMYRTAWRDWENLDRKEKDAVWKPGETQAQAFRRYAEERGKRLIDEAVNDPGVKAAQKAIAEEYGSPERFAAENTPEGRRKARQRQERDAHQLAQRSLQAANENPVLRYMTELDRQSRANEHKGMSIDAAMAKAIQDVQSTIHDTQSMQAFLQAQIREIQMTNARLQQRNRSNMAMGR